jgi:putative hydrolase of the HAD superfamily
MRGDPFRVDAILFDLGGVLIELVGVEQMLAWSPEIADTGELWRRWLGSPAVRRFETGGSTPEDFAAAIVDEFALTVDSGTFLRAFVGWPRALYPGVPALLASLAPRYRLASVSNTNAIHWERFGREWSLDRLFHENFPSHRVGRLKPDADYFAHVLDALALPPERVLFVDDNPLNVEAAVRLGIVARQVAGFAGLSATLAGLGVIGGVAGSG